MSDPRPPEPAAQSPAPTPAPPPDPPVSDVLTRRRAAHAHQVRCVELGAERLRLMADRLADPARPVRDRWYAAWRDAADAVAAGDRDAVVTALTAAADAFRDLHRVAADWLAEARAWLARAKAVDPLFGALVGGRSPSYGRLLPHRAAELEAVAAAAEEVFDWALTLSVSGPPGERVRAMRRGHVPSVGGTDDALDLLQLFADGGRASEIGELLGYTPGVGWLAGLTAVLAGAVVPPPPGHSFRADELPTDEDQRFDAEYLLRLAGWECEFGGDADTFRRRYLPARAPAPAPDGATDGSDPSPEAAGADGSDPSPEAAGADGDDPSPEAAGADGSDPSPEVAGADGDDAANSPRDGLRVEPAADGGDADAPPRDGLWVDPGTFAVRWGPLAVELGNTIGYRLATALIAGRGRFLSVDDLRHRAWGDDEVSDNAIQQAVSALRRGLTDEFGDRVGIDGSQRGHYKLDVYPAGGPVGGRGKRGRPTRDRR